MSRQIGVPLLASLPIDIALREGGDAGVPLMSRPPDSATGKLFASVAAQVDRRFEGLSVEGREASPAS